MFAAQLTTWRMAHGLSVADCAALFGVSHDSITRWEQGATLPAPAVQRLVQLAMEHPIVLRRLRRWRTTEINTHGA